MKFPLPLWLALTTVLLWSPWPSSGALGTVSAVHAGQSIGEAAVVSGAVILERYGRQSPLEEAAPLYNGDIIHTGRDATARLLLGDDSVLSVGPNSRFAIENFETREGSRAARFSVLVGRVRASISRALSQSDVQITTPTAVAGVRGTQFFVDVDEQATATTVSVTSGSIELAPAREQQASPGVPDSGRSMRPSAIPTQPRPTPGRLPLPPLGEAEDQGTPGMPPAEEELTVIQLQAGEKAVLTVSGASEALTLSAEELTALRRHVQEAPRPTHILEGTVSADARPPFAVASAPRRQPGDEAAPEETDGPRILEVPGEAEETGQPSRPLHRLTGQSPVRDLPTGTRARW